MRLSPILAKDSSVLVEVWPWTDSLFGPTPLMRQIVKISKLTVIQICTFCFISMLQIKNTPCQNPARRITPRNSYCLILTVDRKIVHIWTQPLSLSLFFLACQKHNMESNTLCAKQNMMKTALDSQPVSTWRLFYPLHAKNLDTILIQI